jgi:DNA replication and repair protein RecF
LLAYALELAQASLLADCGKPACALIDDSPSELDVDNRRRVMNFLATLRCQCFITAVQPDDLVVDLPGDGAMFHVEHGRIMRT